MLAVAVSMTVVASAGWDASRGSGRGGGSKSTEPSVVPYTVPVNSEFLPKEIRDPVPGTNAYAGNAVATGGDLIAVAASLYSPTPSGPGDSGQVFVLNTSSGASVVLYSPDPASGGQFGEALAVGAGYVVVGAPYEPDPSNSALDDAGAVYVFNATTDALVATLSSPNAESDGNFGTSLAITGSYLVVGAPDEALAGIESGEAYVFNLRTWTSVTLTSPDPTNGGWFGRSVAVGGSWVVVGAPNEGGYAGNAYVYAAPTGDLLETLPHTQGGQFGYSVAVSGSTIVVGAPGANDGEGAAMAFFARSNVSTALPDPHPADGDEFGYSVAVSGDVAVVGAPFQEPDGLAEAGEAYSYLLASGPYVLGQFIADPPQPEDAKAYIAGSLFGWSVALGSVGVVAGAEGQNASGLADAGAAFWFQNLPLTVSDPSPSVEAEFGKSVGISNGILLVGGPYDNGYEGEAFLVNTNTGATIRLADPNATADGYFGWAVAIDGTYAVVSAPGEDLDGSEPASSGDVYVYSASTGALLHTLSSPSAEADSYFGDSVALSGADVAVGAALESLADEPEYSGAAYAYSAATGDAIGSYVSLNPSTYGEFGYSVALSGTTLLVGAPQETGSGVEGAGNAYLIGPVGSVDYDETTLLTPNPVLDDFFGYSVAVSGTAAFVGASRADDGSVSTAGVVYQYLTTTASLTGTYYSLNPVAGGEFGISIATNGATLVVGAAAESGDAITGSGNVYVFSVGSGSGTDVYFSPNALTDGGFGASVGIGPGGAIVVGAPYEPESADPSQYAGNAYLF